MLSRLFAAREVGHVERMHTHPHHGSYSVAEHSYNVASIIAILHPEPSVALLKAALWHDAGERLTGDVPAPAKWNNPHFGNTLDVLEGRATQKLNLYVQITDQEKLWLKGADYLEFYMWCLEQKNMGNKTLHYPMALVAKWFTENPKLPDPIQYVFGILLETGLKRGEDIF